MPFVVRWVEPGNNPTPQSDPSPFALDWGIVGISDQGYVLEVVLLGVVDDEDSQAIARMIGSCWCPVPGTISETCFIPKAHIPSYVKDPANF
jgi:hypothetical protein